MSAQGQNGRVRVFLCLRLPLSGFPARQLRLRAGSVQSECIRAPGQQEEKSVRQLRPHAPFSAAVWPAYFSQTRPGCAKTGIAGSRMQNSLAGQKSAGPGGAREALQPCREARRGTGAVGEAKAAPRARRRKRRSRHSDAKKRRVKEGVQRIKGQRRL